MKHKTAGSIAAVVAIALIAPVLRARPAAAGRGSRINQSLAVTGVDPNARGHAQVVISQSANGMHGKLVVKAAGLDPNSKYEVDLQGVPIGTLVTNPAGSGRAVFNTQPHGHDQLLGVDPRGKDVELRNTSGNGVLQANMPAGTADPTQIQCCVPNGHDQPECESETADQCTAAGGSNMGVGSCIPNPCASTTTPTPAADIVCCKPDDNGTECDLTSAAECSKDGGINVGAGSCDSNPCAATTPQNPETIQCCLSGDSGDSEAECEDRTPDKCTADGGTNMGTGTCHPNPCSQTPASDQVRCCLAGDSGQSECEERTADQCTAQGGTNIGAGSCEQHPCAASPAPTPAQDKTRCCVTNDGQETECENRTPDQCAAHGGKDIGAGSCDPNPCG